MEVKTKTSSDKWLGMYAMIGEINGIKKKKSKNVQFLKIMFYAWM